MLVRSEHLSLAGDPCLPQPNNDANRCIFLLPDTHANRLALLDLVGLSLAYFC